MRLKRVCNGCRALGEATQRQSALIPGSPAYCKLGYPVEEEKRFHPELGWSSYTPIPTIPCPKPTTWNEYDKCDRYSHQDDLKEVNHG